MSEGVEHESGAATRGDIGVNDAARLFGQNPRTFRKALQVFHEQHGSALYRYSEAPNGKLWTNWPALRRFRPAWFTGEETLEVSALDVLELRQLVTDLGRRVMRLERRKVSSK
ncbi:MAG TPA: hypothetical protein VGK73_15145 [Polyangiaceae bacterium]